MKFNHENWSLIVKKKVKKEVVSPMAGTKKTKKQSVKSKGVTKDGNKDDDVKEEEELSPGEDKIKIIFFQKCEINTRKELPGVF